MQDKGLNCLIVGSESLPIKCCDILKSHNHRIAGVMSDDPQIIAWAHKNAATILDPKDQSSAIGFVENHEIDILFSIYNDHVLPAALIEAPRKYSVNYHDGPLPRYAGPNAGAWALLNGEKQHGIAWHLMTNEVDAGDLLALREVRIEPHDTAFTLNARCYEAAIAAFEQLVSDLTKGLETPIPQDSSQRSYFPRSRRPDGFGILNFAHSAQRIRAVVRALDFGPYYPNRFAAAKLLIGREFYLVGRAIIRDQRSSVTPGTIIGISPEGLTVSTATQDITLGNLRSLSGEPAPIEALATANELSPGMGLLLPAQELGNEARVHAECIARHERFWAQRLQNLLPLRLEDVTSPLLKKSFLEQSPAPVSIPGAFIDLLSIAEDTPEKALLAMLPTFLGRFVRQQQFDIALQAPDAKDGSRHQAGLFASWLPLSVTPDYGKTLESNTRTTLKELAVLEKRQGYALDMIGRLQLFPDGSPLGSDGALPVCIRLGHDKNTIFQAPDAYIMIDIAADGSQLTFGSPSEQGSNTAHVLAQSFQVFLESAIESPDAPVGKISILTNTDQRLSIVQWNSTESDYPLSRCLHHFVEDQVRATPNATAVIYQDETVTYAQFNRRANRLARALIELGVGPEALVGVFMERSIEMVVALHATVKAGGAYVPLDPDHPGNRLRSVLEEIDASVVLTQARLRERLPDIAKRVLVVDSGSDDFTAEDDVNPEVPITASSLAYVIYTSGSTGKPKGAMNEHRGVCNRILWMQQEYGLNESDRVLQKTPYSFDVSVWEFFWPLMTGAALVVAKPGEHRDAAYLVDLIDHIQVTTVHFVPSMLRMFLEQRDLGSMASLRRVFCSGEALPLKLHNLFFERLKAELHNLYGPTEAAIDVTYWECRPDPQLKTVPIGAAVANTQVYILDERMQPLPIGITGELFLGGIQIGRGYLKRPQLTAERFLPDPFREAPSARLYRTGDLARYRSDGAIEYLGRTDFQVKIRGFRIELEEIENALLARSDITNAVVVTHRDSSGDDRLVAYLVQDESQPRETGSLEVFQQRVDAWQSIYENTYETPETELAPARNFSTWVSSYTGEAIPEAEMLDWVESTAKRIRALKPRKLLEIGAGMGLLLFRLAPSCREYVATDFSSKAIGYVKSNLDSLPNDSAEIELLQCEASDFSALGNRKFDTVVINSVCQYFPNLDYFLTVLEGALDRLEDGGSVFLGDLRNLELLDVFHGSVVMEQAKEDTTRADLKSRLEQRITQENELLFDPRLFPALRQRFPRIKDVQIQIKESPYLNEMSKYRYDVVLEISSSAKRQAAEVCWTAWRGTDMNIGQIENAMKQHEHTAIGFSGIPNPRLAADVAVLDWLGSACGVSSVSNWKALKVGSSDKNGVDPDHLRQLAAANGYAAEARWGSMGPSKIDVLFWPEGRSKPDFVPVAGDLTPAFENLVNDPMNASRTEARVAEMRCYLGERLPDYMIPSFFVFMDSLPLSANGKLDRKALPPPAAESSALRGLGQPPRNAMETKIADIWKHVIGHTVGVTDNFFDIGGDSLKAMGLILKLEELLSREFRLDVLFEYPTIEAFCEFLTDTAQTEKQVTDCLVTIKPGSPQKIPLFLVHDADGETILYRHLADRIDGDRPTYGLRPPKTPEKSIEATAATFVRALRRVQPHGPYLIGGLCAGGVLAAEIAIQLQTAGEEVPLVVALDAVDAEAPIRNVKSEKRGARIWQLFDDSLHSKRPLSGAVNVAWELGRKSLNATRYELTNLKEKSALEHEYKKLRNAEDAALRDGSLKIQLTTRQLFNLAVKDYRPQKLDATIVLFRATEAILVDDPEIDDTPLRTTTDDVAFGWRQRTTGDVLIFDVPGGHSSMLQPPNVNFIAVELNRRLYRCFAGRAEEAIDSCCERAITFHESAEL